MVFNSIYNDLIGFSNPQRNQFVKVLGCNAPADGGGGDFYYQVSETGSSPLKIDGINIISDNLGKGNWIRMAPLQLPDSGALRICYAQGVGSLSDFLAIKQAGFNSLIHYRYLAPANAMSHLDLCNLALMAGLGVIINLTPFNDLNGIQEVITETDSHPAVIGYYLYDEPDGVHQFSIKDQDIKINILRKRSLKSLFVCMTVENGLDPLLSSNFDVYLLSVYNTISGSFTAYGAKGDQKRFNAHKMGLQSALYKELYPGKTIIPIITAFSGGNGQFGYSEDLISLTRSFYAYFSENNCTAAFIWDSGAGTDVVEGIRDQVNYLNLVKLMNGIAQNGLKGKKETFIYRTDRAAKLIQENLPISNPDIGFYSIINVGQGKSNREQNFSAQGIGIRKKGGIMAFQCPSVHTIRWVGRYVNYVDLSTIGCDLIRSEADYYYENDQNNNIVVLSKASNIASRQIIDLWADAWEMPFQSLNSVGIHIQTQSSNDFFMKFIQEGYLAGF